MGDFVAHHYEADGRRHIQTVHDHNTGVAILARQFAEAFNAGPDAFIAGMLHDIGKYTPEFQRYIMSDGGVRGSVPHAAAGAWEAFSRNMGHIAMAINAHHGRLANWTELLKEANWKERASKLRDASMAAGWQLPELPESVLSAWAADLQGKDACKYAMECLTRMLFSALVDADWLDTEAFMSPDKASLRVSAEPLDSLRKRLDDHLVALSGGADRTSVNEHRNQILQGTLAAAGGKPGVYSLAVPTGGGKTLASMAFALKHAIHNDLRRVIVAIPYTSIIEQNAKIYRDVLGEDNVIEHHSCLDPEKETQRNQLACENWDAPVIVTTNVQLFESLFSNRRAACRKLHNVAGSVIIMDEAQTLPPGMLTPTLSMIQTLHEKFNVSFIICTATQPAFGKRRIGPGHMFPGIETIRDIIPDSSKFFGALRRVEITWPEDIDESVSWESIADELADCPRVLAIVNRRRDAYELAELMDEDTFHLSALMTPEHRMVVLNDIRERLVDPSATCRVVATSLVEAGVDLDFPVVYRAFAPLDSIAQAAGRCNREGKLTDANGAPAMGRVVVFVPPSKPLPGVHSVGTETTKTMLRGGPIDICDPEVYRKYFEGLYTARNPDLANVQQARQKWKFKETEEKYRLIDDDWSEAIIVPRDDRARDAVRRVRAGDSPRDAMRVLQRYSVSVSKKTVIEWVAGGVLAPLFEFGDSKGADQCEPGGPYVLNREYLKTAYHDARFGLGVDELPLMDPEATTV